MMEIIEESKQGESLILETNPKKLKLFIESCIEFFGQRN
jgi:hypothetical protein